MPREKRILAQRRPLEERGPLRVMFLLTTMPVGGAETLLANLVRSMNREEFVPEIGCLKYRDELGELLAGEVEVSSGYLRGKYDLRVLPRLVRYFRRRRIDVLVTVGAGDKMFWGRLAARWAGVPVVCCALHSTGWPDSIGRANRMLTRWTDAFIAVAPAHGAYLVAQEGLPAEKVTVIQNGVDCRRFIRSAEARRTVRAQLRINPASPVVGIVAALRPEKRHDLFLEVARQVLDAIPRTRFLVVGDGPLRADLEEAAMRLGIDQSVLFLGTRRDVPEILSAMDLLLLTSDNEASPVSVLEALACELPVVATDVGSVSETVIPGRTGLLAQPGDRDGLASAVLQILGNADFAASLGRRGRMLVEEEWSLDGMVRGYEALFRRLYRRKVRPSAVCRPCAASSGIGYQTARDYDIQ